MELDICSFIPHLPRLTAGFFLLVFFMAMGITAIATTVGACSYSQGRSGKIRYIYTVWDGETPVFSGRPAEVKEKYGWTQQRVLTAARHNALVANQYRITRTLI